MLCYDLDTLKRGHAKLGGNFRFNAEWVSLNVYNASKKDVYSLAAFLSFFSFFDLRVVSSEGIVTSCFDFLLSFDSFLSFVSSSSFFDFLSFEDFFNARDSACLGSVDIGVG